MRKARAGQRGRALSRLGACLLVVGSLSTAGGVFAATTDSAQTGDASIETGAITTGLLAGIGDGVWDDQDHDGLQDLGEPGIDGTTVTLLDGGGAPVTVDGNGAPLGPRTTVGGGAYHFADLSPGTYRVQFSDLPPGAVHTLRGGGPGDGTDSDPDPATGITGDVVLAAGEDDVTIDAGVFIPAPALALEKRVQGVDANTAPGPMLAVGSTATFDYVVTNTGNDPLTSLSVADDRGVTVTCPQTTVGLGETVTCTGSATVVAGPYTNVGTAAAVGATAPTPVSAEDSAHYTGVEALLGLEKQVNGTDADSAADPLELAAGEPVTFSFRVANTGTEAVESIALTDASTGAVACPSTTLASGASMDCTAISDTAVPGLHTNVATVSGTGRDTATQAGATDSASYFGIDARMSLLKEAYDPATNGYRDADDVSGSPGSNDGLPATVSSGATATFRLSLANGGNVALPDVTVADPSCDADPTLVSGDGGTPGTLDVGETWVLACERAHVTSAFTNTATASSGDLETNETAQVEVASGTAAVTITKKVQDPATGQFGDDATVVSGQAATFRLRVTNTGDLALSNLVVGDPLGPSCARTIPGPLAPGASTATWTCDSVGVTAAFTNTATVSATPSGGGDPVTASDTAAVAVVVPGAADLSLEKSLDGQAAGTASWRLTVTNHGPGDSVGPVSVEDRLPAGLAFQRAAGAGWTCAADGQTVTCTHASGLAEGEVASVVLTTTVSATVQSDVRNTAVLAGAADSNATNNSGAAVLSVGQTATTTTTTTRPGTGGGGPSRGPLPATGVEIAGLVVAGLAALALGALLLWSGRRQRRTMEAT